MRFVLVFLTLIFLCFLGKVDSAHSVNFVESGIAATTSYGAVNSPGGEQYYNVTDDIFGTKYLNFNKTNVGFTVRLSTAAIIRRLSLTTANDAAERDPTTIAVYGSNTQGQLGTLIINNLATGLSTNRFATNDITFENSTSYSYYTVVFLTIRNYAAANSVQLAEASFYYDTQYSPSPVYVSAITPTQQSLYNAALSRKTAISQNSVHIDQVGAYNVLDIQQTGSGNMIAGIGATALPIQGNSNEVTIKQGNVSNPFGKNLIEANVYGYYNSLDLNQGQTSLDYGGHMQTVSISGDNNSLTTDQRNSGNYGHYLNTNITGNNNTQNILQAGNAIKNTFITTTGNSNTATALQDGLGDHYLSLTMTGNSNDAIVDQTGNSKNSATINLTNAGSPASVTLTQTGGQTYSLDRTCTIACGRVTVTQQ